MAATQLLLFALYAASDAGAPPPPAAAPTPTTQQQFDAAEDERAAGHCSTALAAYALLESRPAVARDPRVLSVVRVHEADCQLRTGQDGLAASTALAGLAALDGRDDRDDLVLAHEVIGQVAYRGFDYPRAASEFAAARALANGARALEAAVWLARSTLFDEGNASIEAAADALRIAGSSNAATDKSVMAQLHTLHGRALLNHGQAEAAYAELHAVMQAQGGLTTHVSLEQVVTRGDLAIASMLTHREESAHRYLTYSGAGHFDKSPFASAIEAQPPPCGGSAGLLPDDTAIVEFSVGNDGSVSRVTPVWASRNGPAAAEFARAVAGWSWRPEDAVAIPAFFRLLTRVQLRCSTASAHPDVLAQLEPAVDAWLAAHALQPRDPATSPVQAAAAARARLGQLGPAAGLARLPALLAAIGNPMFLPAERADWLRQARQLFADAGAPPAVLAWIEAQVVASSYWGSRDDWKARRNGLRALLARSDLAADARAAAVLRLLVAEGHYGSPPPQDAEALLLATANDPALSADDPLRAGALVRLASLQAAAGRVDAARESYQRSGVSAQQCSMVDAVPAARSYGDGNFPMEALQWGFEGWVIVQFDIRGDGLTENRRAVIEYPPLVFGDAAEQALRLARYQQTYRPAGATGCGGKETKVNFQRRR